MAAALGQAHGADDVHLYGIDCGNGALNALTALPHCGAVVDRNQIERLGRLLDRLGAELTARQSILGARGTADLTELRRAQPAEERLAHIVLMVDRFEVFEREFTAYDNGSYMERMIRLLRDGAGVGIHVVLAGDRVLGSSRFSGTTEDKIVLRLNDRQDYSSVGIPSKSAPRSGTTCACCATGTAARSSSPPTTWRRRRTATASASSTRAGWSPRARPSR
ncbi:FtsK/SpoIIIE domain-containing protein [Streptomyces sp. NPDC005921]